MENILERRAHERFAMKLPATFIRPSPDATGNGCRLVLTKDVSQGGAYFHVPQPFEYEGPVEVEILIEVLSDGSSSHYAYMTAGGEVVRRDGSGVAVSFHEDFRLRPFHIQ